MLCLLSWFILSVNVFILTVSFTIMLAIFPFISVHAWVRINYTTTLLKNRTCTHIVSWQCHNVMYVMVTWGVSTVKNGVIHTEMRRVLFFWITFMKCLLSFDSFDWGHHFQTKVVRYGSIGRDYSIRIIIMALWHTLDLEVFKHR